MLLALPFPTARSGLAQVWLAARAPALEPCWMAALPPLALPRAEAERRFAALLASAGDAIWRLCRFRERNPDAWRDLYQEIALAIWQALPTFRGDASERTWALRIAHNVAATHVGRVVRQRKLAPLGLDEESASPASPGLDPEQRLDLLGRLRALDLPSQQLVLLHLEGLSTREIADVTGLTPSNVTTRLTRLRQRLSDGATPALEPSPGHASTAAEEARP